MAQAVHSRGDRAHHVSQRPHPRHRELLAAGTLGIISPHQLVAAGQWGGGGGGGGGGETHARGRTPKAAVLIKCPRCESAAVVIKRSSGHQAPRCSSSAAAVRSDVQRRAWPLQSSPVIISPREIAEGLWQGGQIERADIERLQSRRERADRQGHPGERRAAEEVERVQG